MKKKIFITIAFITIELGMFYGWFKNGYTLSLLLYQDIMPQSWLSADNDFSYDFPVIILFSLPLVLLYLISKKTNYLFKCLLMVIFYLMLTLLDIRWNKLVFYMVVGNIIFFIYQSKRNS